MSSTFKRSVFSGILILCASRLSPAQAPDARAEVLEADRMYRQAVLDGNRNQLAALFADDILIVHSDGTTDTKANFLDAISSGRLKMRTYERMDLQLRLFGPVAVLFSKTKKGFAYKGSPGVDLDLSTVTFAKQATGWKIVAMQNTHASQ